MGNLFRETYWCQYFNNVFWQNDPDVVHLRKENSKFSDEEALSVALWDGFLGGVVNTSDRFHAIPPERLSLWRFLQPGSEPGTAVFPFWPAQKTVIAAVREYPAIKAWGVLFVNTGSDPVEEEFLVRDLCEKEELWVCSWGPGGSESRGSLSRISVKLQGHQSALFYLGVENSPPPKNLTVAGVLSSPT